LLAAAPELVGACAAIFSPEAQVRQSAQRIIFAVDHQAGMIEAYVSVNYVGAAENFAWVVPLPSNPKVDVVEAESFNAIERATEPRFRFPSKSCFELTLGAGSGAPPGAEGGLNVYQQGQVGPYDFSVVGGPNAGELTDWLRQNGYRVTPPMEPLIKSYSDAGMLFLAMKLQGGKEAGDIQPVKMTFKADKAMIPLRLAAVGAQPQTELLVWVFADQQVVPENMDRVTIPDDQVVLTDFDAGRNNYRDLVNTALVKSGGRGLITEVAQPSKGLAVAGDSLIGSLKSRFPYVTRFYGRFDPEQMTVDPAFVPSNQLPDIPIEHDFRSRINPYDCGNQSILAPADQIVERQSLQGLWVSNRWLLVYIAFPLLVLVLIAAAVIGVARRKGQQT
jgi:hypothetical protein